MVESFFEGIERKDVELRSRQRFRSVWPGGLHKREETRRRTMGMGTDKRQIVDGSEDEGPFSWGCCKIPRERGFAFSLVCRTGMGMGSRWEALGGGLCEADTHNGPPPTSVTGLDMGVRNLLRKWRSIQQHNIPSSTGRQKGKGIHRRHAEPKQVQTTMARKACLDLASSGESARMGNTGAGPPKVRWESTS